MGDSSGKLPGTKTAPYELDLKPGCRVQLSCLGTKRCPKLGIRTGTILSMARNANGFRVQFDGAKSPQSLHRSYIMPINQNKSTSEPRAQ